MYIYRGTGTNKKTNKPFPKDFCHPSKHGHGPPKTWKMKGTAGGSTFTLTNQIFIFWWDRQCFNLKVCIFVFGCMKGICDLIQSMSSWSQSPVPLFIPRFLVLVSTTPPPPSSWLALFSKCFKLSSSSPWYLEWLSWTLSQNMSHWVSLKKGIEGQNLLPRITSAPNCSPTIPLLSGSALSACPQVLILVIISLVALALSTRRSSHWRFWNFCDRFLFVFLTLWLSITPWDRKFSKSIRTVFRMWIISHLRTFEGSNAELLRGT